MKLSADGDSCHPELCSSQATLKRKLRQWQCEGGRGGRGGQSGAGLGLPRLPLGSDTVGQGTPAGDIPQIPGCKPKARLSNDSKDLA